MGERLREGGGGVRGEEGGEGDCGLGEGGGGGEGGVWVGVAREGTKRRS